MFKTAPKLDTRNPQRPVYTPIAKMARRVKISLNERVEQEQRQGGFSQLRPMTTPLVQRKQFSTILQSSNNSNLVNMKSIDAVYTELDETYKGQMCGYLKSKLRRLVDKRKQDVVYSRYLDQSIQNERESMIKSSVVGPLNEFYSTFRKNDRLKIEKGVDQIYLSNAKERISRLV